MAPAHTVHSVQSITCLLVVATVVAIIVKRVRIPYTIALVIAGLVISSIQVLPAMVMTPELVSFIFLPPLLFESGWNIHFDRLKQDWFSVSVLAVVGVAISLVVTAFIMYSAGCLAISSALLVGAILSATDPISVIATFRKMGIDKRLTVILEGESLFNDGTAMVAFSLLLAFVTAPTQSSLVATLISFPVIVLGGALIGLVFGIAASKIIARFDDHLLAIMLSMTVAYGSFLVADALKVSPIIAAATAGIVLANIKDQALAASSCFAINSFWECVTYVVNSVVFLLIGLQVHIDAFMKNAGLIAVGIFALLVSRAVVVYLLCPLISKASAPIPLAWQHVLWWGALRGALSMVMAMSLPQNLPMREQLIVLVFGLVIFTLLVPGLTIESVVGALKIPRSDPPAKKLQPVETIGQKVLSVV